MCGVIRLNCWAPLALHFNSALLVNKEVPPHNGTFLTLSPFCIFILDLEVDVILEKMENRDPKLITAI